MVEADEERRSMGPKGCLFQAKYALSGASGAVAVLAWLYVQFA